MAFVRPCRTVPNRPGYPVSMTTYALRRVRLRPGEELQDAVEIALEPFVLGGQRYLPVPSEVEASLAIQRATSGDVFRLRFVAQVHGPCMRCLRDAVQTISVDGREYHAADGSSDEELRSDYVVDDVLDLSQWARDAIAVALPDQILCRPGCAGLCPVCGQTLEGGPHDHGAAPPDPRWTPLEALRRDG